MNLPAEIEDTLSKVEAELRALRQAAPDIDVIDVLEGSSESIAELLESVDDPAQREVITARYRAAHQAAVASMR
jgi:hypothetical protein